jgi:hypothetical protein
MLNGGATAVHRVKHTFLHQLSGWYLKLQKAHSYFSQFSKSLFMVALHLIIHELWSSLGSLFGLGVVSHVSTHLLLTALQLNNCWYQPQSKHNSIYALQSCADDIVLQHTNLKCNTTQRNILCTYRTTQCIRWVYGTYPAHPVQMCCNVIHTTCSPSQLCCSTQAPYPMKALLNP